MKTLKTPPKKKKNLLELTDSGKLQYTKAVYGELPGGLV